MGTRTMAAAMVVALATVAFGQTTAPATNPSSTAPASAMIDPLADRTLVMLQDRKATLKDFQAGVTYDVYHTRTDDHEGKTGTVDFLEDDAKGPTFSVHFAHDTVDGKPVKAHEQDIVFDGRKMTLIDRRAMQYHQQDILPPGAKPGDAVSLNGDLPLPIGLKATEVEENFAVTVLPAKNENQTVLKLVPKGEVKGHYDFKVLELTVDKTLQLPVKMVRTDKKGDVTTIEFTEPKPNGGKAKMIDASVPKGDGWDIDIK